VQLLAIRRHLITIMDAFPEFREFFAPCNGVASFGDLRDRVAFEIIVWKDQAPSWPPCLEIREQGVQKSRGYSESRHKAPSS
jgi:hypothetical protein